METTPFSNAASHQRFLAIAAKIEHDPALLEIPLANIDRWIANGIDAQHRLEQWRSLIISAQKSPGGMKILLTALRDDSEEACQLKSYSPFPGILNSQETRELSCGYSH